MTLPQLHKQWHFGGFDFVESSFDKILQNVTMFDLFLVSKNSVMFESQFVTRSNRRLEHHVMLSFELLVFWHFSGLLLYFTRGVAEAKCILVVAICVSVCLSLATLPHYCMDPDVTRRNGRGCPLVVHYWADLQSVHGFHCYDNIAPNAKCQRVLVGWLVGWLGFNGTFNTE